MSEQNVTRGPQCEPTPPLGQKIYILKYKVYCIEPALQHRFNEAIGKLIQVRGAEISSSEADWFQLFLHK